MSFLSVLGNIGKFALPFIPGIGPVADKVVRGIETAGKMAGGASQQRAQDRGAQAEYDAMRIPLENQVGLNYANSRLSADRARRGQLAGLDLSQNYKAPTDPRAQQFLTQGGMSPETLQLMRDRTMSAFNSGSDIPQMQSMPTKPGGGPTGMDSFLNALSLGSTALGGLREAGLFGNDGGRQSSMGAPAKVAQGIFDNQPEEPWWSPLRRGN